MSERARRWGPLLVLSVVVGGLLLWGGWRWWEVRRHRAEMAEIEEDMENGRHATASRKLNSLLARRPDSDEALYLLGTCEMSRGRAELADDAWARVPPDSLFAARAILGRMQIQMERGRLTEAERIIRDALDDPRVDGSNLPILLGPVYCQEGRLAETLRSIEVRWDALDRAGEGASEPAINLVRGYIELRQSPMPVDVIRSALDQAAVSAPDDDRVWLGRANLAIREGEYDEAARWIDAGLRRRPDDVPVWRARLDWAVATNRVAEAREALKHLPVEETTPAEVPRLAAWLAARRGNLAAERRALERLVEVDPSDAAALDRLAELSIREDQPAHAAELRARRAEIDRLKARYEKLHRRNQPARDAEEMARLAEQIGHPFEAVAFLTIATAVAPDRVDLRRELARLRRQSRSIDDPRRTLADALGDELREPIPVSAARPNERGSLTD